MRWHRDPYYHEKRPLQVLLHEEYGLIGLKNEKRHPFNKGPWLLECGSGITCERKNCRGTYDIWAKPIWEDDPRYNGYKRSRIHTKWQKKKRDFQRKTYKVEIENLTVVCPVCRDGIHISDLSEFSVHCLESYIWHFVSELYAFLYNADIKCLHILGSPKDYAYATETKTHSWGWADHNTYIYALNGKEHHTKDPDIQFKPNPLSDFEIRDYLRLSLLAKTSIECHVNDPKAFNPIDRKFMNEKGILIGKRLGANDYEQLEVDYDSERLHSVFIDKGGLKGDFEILFPYRLLHDSRGENLD